MKQSGLIIAGILVLALIAMLALIIQITSGPSVIQETQAINPAYSLNDTYTRADFHYGPQDWKPYYSPLPLTPEQVNGSGNFSLMYLDLRSTPCGMVDGKPYSGAVALDYHIINGSGLAAFHVYGYSEVSTQGKGIAWTNKPSGSGANGFYVLVNSSIKPGAPEQYLQPGSNETVVVSNHGNTTGATFPLNFRKSGGGLNSLHISVDPGDSQGQVTLTGEQSGRFYVTSTGNQPLDTVLLLVAVNGSLPDNFSLHLAAYPVNA